MQLLLFLVVAIFLNTGQCSVGDKSRYYSSCVSNCIRNICEKGHHTRWLWSCEQDCDYDCQWETVAAFHARGWDTPQFFGKWPFIRIFGLQEPASVLFSLINLITVVILTRRFNRCVGKGRPYRLLWFIYSLVIGNAWFWSIIYHSRESDLTERLDYSAASFFVFFSFYVMTVRVFQLTIDIKGILWTATSAGIILQHINWLWSPQIPYKNNIIFNVIIGGIAVVGWLAWYWKNRKIHHTKYIAMYSLGIAFCTLFELQDFPPLFWTLDAHSIWHLLTSFVTILIYQFMTFDCIYLGANDSTIIDLPTFHKLE